MSKRQEICDLAQAIIIKELARLTEEFNATEFEWAIRRATFAANMHAVFRLQPWEAA